MNVENKILLSDLEATQKTAQQLAPYLHAGDVLLLEGDLGAGKTSFARALIIALGGADDVPSPTFTIVQSYPLEKLTVYHFDLYRLEQQSEIEETGFEDAMSDGLVLVEWPEKAAAYMPRGAHKLVFTIEEDGRHSITFDQAEGWGVRLEEFWQCQQKQS